MQRKMSALGYRVLTAVTTRRAGGYEVLLRIRIRRVGVEEAGSVLFVAFGLAEDRLGMSHEFAEGTVQG